jgi:CHASE3 domain sensor protein
MDQEILKKLEEQEKKIEAIWVSVEKTRKYFKTTLIVTVAMIILPLIGLAFAIPFYLNILSSSMNGL